MDGVLTALAAFYGPLATPPADLFAFFVWEMVSARALPARRDIAWQALKRLPALTPDAMFRASKDDLKTAIDGLGGFEERLEALRAGQRTLPPPPRPARRSSSGRSSGPLRALRDVPHLTPRCAGAGAASSPAATPCPRWMTRWRASWRDCRA